MTDLLYNYRARPVRVIDGDTIEVYIDLGFHLYRTEHVRVLGVNCPERGQAGYEAATAYTKGWLTQFALGEWPLSLSTKKGDSFGRWLAIVTASGRNLGIDLWTDGHAVLYDR